ncbi:hypothetical protein [Paludisphaera sp.]|uniref:hypothetical protein n=1 Tax=Paludisphaera sp. TaxID=2017432 RepID=UPI00301D5FFE
MRRRVLKFLKWAAIATGLSLVAFFLWSVWYTGVTGRRLEARLDALRRAGDPVSLADLAPRPISPETNADAALQDVAAEVEAVQKGLMAIFPNTGRPEGALDPESQARVEALFRDHPRAIPGILEAAGRPDYASDRDVSLPTQEFLSRRMDAIQGRRTASRVLAAWSMLLTTQGKLDEAIAANVAGLRLSAHWAREPLIIDYLVSVATTRVAMTEAEKTLRSGPASEESRRALDAELARHDGLDGYRRALRTERAFSMAVCREMASQMLFWMRGWLLNNALLMFMDFYEEQLERSRTPYPGLAALGPATAARAYWHPMRPLADLLEPSVLAARRAAETQRAAVRGLRVLNALQRLGVDEPPADLTTLDLPAEATVDPFTGRPLIVKKLAEGWLVYSVGPDLVDDGGTLDKARDVGYGPVVGP